MHGPQPGSHATHRDDGSRSFRLLVDPPADGAWNMAVDEALLESCARSPGASRPTLRIYGWCPPTLSLGRSQDARTAHDPRFLRDAGIGLVRRPTGGKAVLHEHERTYAVVGALRRAPFPGGVLDTYRRVAAALSAALEGLGIAARAVEPERAERSGPRAGDVSCFAAASAHEITVDARKLIGSAQLRRRGAFLQHGSILLDSDPGRLAAALGAPAAAGRFTDLRHVLNRVVDPGELDRALVAAFEAAFGARCDPGALTAEESDLAARLRCWKYDSGAWTLDGRMGERERRWGPSLTLR